jgi:hypothetical protein
MQYDDSQARQRAAMLVEQFERLDPARQELVLNILADLVSRTLSNGPHTTHAVSATLQ